MSISALGKEKKKKKTHFHFAFIGRYVDFSPEISKLPDPGVLHFSWRQSVLYE